MAAFLRRALGLPSPLLRVPMSNHANLACSPTGDVCSITVDVRAGKSYKIEEGVFQALPASEAELEEFNSPATRFNLSVDGVEVQLIEEQQSEENRVAIRHWEYPLTFTPGNHTLVGKWIWNNTQIQLTTVTVRASG